MENVIYRDKTTYVKALIVKKIYPIYWFFEENFSKQARGVTGNRN